MLPFRTEISNSPKEQTLLVYLNDITLDSELKELIEKIKGVRLVEIESSVSRNRVAENITIYKEPEVKMNDLSDKINEFLDGYFERIDI